MEILASDRGLLRRFREGDREALAKVYWAYVDNVERILRARSAGARAGSGSDLEDLVQEVFIKAFSPDARLSYDGLRPYLPYLYTIARNVLVDWWRRSGREIPTELSFDQAGDDAALGDATDAFADASTTAMVTGFLRGLPEELRTVHEARFCRGLSQRDAAAALGIGRQTLRTLERRLIELLRQTLEGDGGKPVAAPSENPRRWGRWRGGPG